MRSWSTTNSNLLNWPSLSSNREAHLLLSGLSGDTVIFATLHDDLDRLKICDRETYSVEDLTDCMDVWNEDVGRKSERDTRTKKDVTTITYSNAAISLSSPDNRHSTSTQSKSGHLYPLWPTMSSSTPCLKLIELLQGNFGVPGTLNDQDQPSELMTLRCRCPPF